MGRPDNTQEIFQAPTHWTWSIGQVAGAAPKQIRRTGIQGEMDEQGNVMYSVHYTAARVYAYSMYFIDPKK
jgi:hypothetical protein